MNSGLPDDQTRSNPASKSQKGEFQIEKRRESFKSKGGFPRVWSEPIHQGRPPLFRKNKAFDYSNPPQPLRSLKVRKRLSFEEFQP